MSEPMTPERWETTQELLLGSLEIPEHERGSFLSEACGGDNALRQEVESLLQAHSTSGPVDRLADTLGARVLAEFIEGGGLEGETVGRYEIRERLGRGGMSVVYRAWDPKLERDIALKFLPALLSSDRTSRERFLVEAQVAAGLEHPNICTIHEIGEAEDGRLFIAMPLYEGETVRAKLESGPLSEGDTLQLALQAARGLAKAHESGVIHRDVKPGNLMITRDGTLKILDFGIAQLEGAADPTGQTPGTAHYMSPEQVAGRQVDARTDLWSLGVVLYEMVAGRRPMEGRTVEAVRRAILEEDVAPLARVRPDISPEIDALIRSLLHKDPSRRMASATELVGEVRRLRKGRQEDALQSRPRRRVVVAAGAVGVAVLAAAGVWSWSDGLSSRREAAEGPPGGLSELGAPSTGPASHLQPDLARIADALVVERPADQGERVDLPPTDNPDAYEYYVRGKALLTDPLAAPGASGDAEWMFRQAVRLDSTFALAWAALAEWHSSAVGGVNALSQAIHRNPTLPGPGQLTADIALARAVTYGPDLPETIKARGWYLFNVERDRGSALQHFEDALRERPYDPDLVGAMGLIRISLGQWEEGLPYLERALRLDPGGYWRAVLLGQMYTHLRRYDEAERLYDSALTAAPTYAEAYIGKAIVQLKRDGDVRGATRVLEEASRKVDRGELVYRIAQPAGRYPFIRILDGFFHAGFADTAVARHVHSRCVLCYWHVRAQVAEQRGEPDVARIYYDSAFTGFVPEPELPPPSYRYAALFAAGLGLNQEAIRYADSVVARGIKLSSEAISGYHRLESLAEVYVRAGEFEDAIAGLEQLLSHPGLLSVPILELDPLWDPLRAHPDFQRLLDEYR